MDRVWRSFGSGWLVPDSTICIGSPCTMSRAQLEFVEEVFTALVVRLLCFWWWITVFVVGIVDNPMTARFETQVWLVDDDPDPPRWGGLGVRGRLFKSLLNESPEVLPPGWWCTAATRCTLYPFPVLLSEDATWTIDSLLEDSEDEDSDNGDLRDDAEEIEVNEGERDSHWFFLPAPRVLGNVPGWPPPDDEVPVGGGPKGPMGYSVPAEVIIASANKNKNKCLNLLKKPKKITLNFTQKCIFRKKGCIDWIFSKPAFLPNIIGFFCLSKFLFCFLNCLLIHYVNHRRGSFLFVKMLKENSKI